MQSRNRPVRPMVDQSAPTSRRRRTPPLVIALLAGIAVIAAVAAVLIVTPTSTSLPGITVLSPGWTPGRDDGFLAEGETLSPFDDDAPAIAQLDPALRAAMQDAARAAMDDGVEFFVQSGWRSAAYQQWLLDDAVQQYGGLVEAERFVSSPERSHHVSGAAVDIGPTDAMSWLQQRGAEFDLCQTYANEMWHWELAPTPGACPEQLSDAGAG